MHIGELQLYNLNPNNQYVALRFENIGIWDIYNVHVELQSYMFNEQNERETKIINLTKSDVPIIQNIFSRKTDKSYLIISADTIPNIELIGKCEGIRCRISAINSFSGICYVYEKEYKKQ